MNERTMTEQKEQRNWLVLRTLNRRERDVSDFLKEKGLPHFIPMRYKEKATPDGKLQRVLVPVVHNYLFVEEQMPVQEMKSLMAECRYPLRRRRKSPCAPGISGPPERVSFWRRRGCTARFCPFPCCPGRTRSAGRWNSRAP